MLRYTLLFLIVYVPNQSHFPQSLGVKGLNLLNVLLIVTLFLYKISKEKSNDPSPLLKSISYYYFVVILALGTAFIKGSAHFVTDLTIAKTVFTYSLLMYLYFYANRDIKSIKESILVIVLVVAMVSLEIFREALASGIGSGRRVAGPFGQEQSAANYAGVFLAVYLPVCFSFALFYRKELYVYAGGLATYFLGVFAIFYTYSRQAYASLAVTSLFLGIAKNKLIAVFLFILLANYSLWVPEATLNRIERTTELDEFGQEVLDSSTESRFVIWENAWTIIRSNPFGIGFNQFQDEIDPYMPDWITARDAHNQFVLITTELGFQGLLAFLILIGAFFVVASRFRKVANDQYSKALAYGYTFSIVAVILGNVYSSTFFSGEVTGLFWVLTGLVIRYTFILKNGGDENDSDGHEQKALVANEHAVFSEKRDFFDESK